jgi:N6-adenosine-specific RNA methylase IME4
MQSSATNAEANGAKHMRLGSNSFSSIDEWAQVGVALGDLERTTLWQVGDWWLKGRAEFGRGRCKAIVEQGGWRGPTYSTCRTASSIARLFPQVLRRLDIGFAHHQAVASLYRADPEAALSLLDAAVAGRWSQNKTRIEAGRHRSGFYVKPGDAIFTSLGELIKSGKRFGAILTDPPWQFEVGNRQGLQRGGHGRFYECMPLGELCALPVWQIITDATFLFMWTPAALIPDALAVLDAWGFTWRTHGIWGKDKEPGTGFYFRMHHEDLVLGVSPKCRPFFEKPSSIINAPRGEHSEKPSIHEMIEAACDGPYAELFARRSYPGWTCVGDQLPPSDGTKAIGG